MHGLFDTICILIGLVSGTENKTSTRQNNNIFFTHIVLHLNSCCFLKQLTCKPSRLELLNTLTASLLRGKTPPPTSVLNITLNNLMVRFQQHWSFGECGVPPSLPLLPGSLWSGVVVPDKGPIYGLNRTKWWLEYTVFSAFGQRIYTELNCLK